MTDETMRTHMNSAEDPTTVADGIFQPLRLRGVELRNRVVASPMSMYSSHEGAATDFHLVHLGRFALGGAGLVTMEATAVQRDGRVTHGCNGLWADEQVGPLRRITDFLHGQGSHASIQLFHSGPKGSTQRPWHGYRSLGDQDLTERGEHPWRTLTATDLTLAEMDVLVGDFAAAASRAVSAGFDVVELHFAHGYLLHDFLSPLTNGRSDEYGGSLENRMRLPLRVFDAVRDALPDEVPVLVRISAVDGVGIGWSLEDSVALAHVLAGRRVDAIVCSSGGVTVGREHVLPARAPLFQVPFAERIRAESGVPSMAVGLITTRAEADSIIGEGRADLVALGRELLVDPNWVLRAGNDASPAGWGAWPEQYGWWLERRARYFPATQTD